MTVLISGNRITAVGSSKEIPIPKQIRVIDGRGNFLIPGLWDMHVHSDGDEHALRMMVDWGITGARDMGGDLTKLTEARRHIANQDWTGPQLVIAGPEATRGMAHQYKRPLHTSLIKQRMRTIVSASRGPFLGSLQPCPARSYEETRIICESCGCTFRHRDQGALAAASITTAGEPVPEQSICICSPSTA
jgi:hypothetical protein